MRIVNWRGKLWRYFLSPNIENEVNVRYRIIKPIALEPWDIDGIVIRDL